MGFLKPKTVSTPTNQFAGQINTAYSPQIAQGNQSTNMLSQLLGVGGDPDEAWSQYKEKAGYAPALSALQQGVTNGGAAAGLLNSGSTQKALLKQGANLDSSMFNNFLQSLAGVSGLGLQAGNLVSNAGNVQNSQQSSTGSKILSGLGAAASIFSDRRTKKNIKLVDRFEDGLGLYTFRYLDELPGDELRGGVMADEVARLRPWALGPVIGGFQTVNYARL